MPRIYEYKNSTVYVNEYKFNTYNGILRAWRCPFCMSDIKQNDEVVAIFNNHKHFPNTLTHKGCFDEMPVVENDFTPAFETIEDLYRQYMKLDDIFQNPINAIFY